MAAEGLSVRKSEALDAHLERTMTDAAFWGVSDCVLWPADWVVASGWADPAEAHRGRYRTALGAARLVVRAGGLESMWRTEAARIGLRETNRPIAGDVGLALRETRGAGPALSGLVGAICLGGGEWACRTGGGLRSGRWPVVRAWRVPWRRR